MSNVRRARRSSSSSDSSSASGGEEEEGVVKAEKSEVVITTQPAADDDSGKSGDEKSSRRRRSRSGDRQRRGRSRSSSRERRPRRRGLVDEDYEDRKRNRSKGGEDGRRDSQRNQRRWYRDYDRPDEEDQTADRDREMHRRREEKAFDRKIEEAWKNNPRKRSHREDNESQNADRREKVVEKEPPPPAAPAPPAKSTLDNDLLMRSGGAYIPPAKLKAMQAKITDKSSVQYQRIQWEALKKSIHGLVNKANSSNIASIVRELFAENIIRGRGLLARSIIQSAVTAQSYASVHASLLAAINTQFPMIGELVLKRLITQFQKGFRRNDKRICLGATKFIAQLVNQQVAHEVLALEIMSLLLENATDDSIEIAISFLKECGAKMKEVSNRGLHFIVDRFRTILHEANLDSRTQYMIEVVFAVFKDNFADYPAIIKELDIVDEEDQYTHLLSLSEKYDEEKMHDVFKADPNFLENEAKYEEVKKQILGMSILKEIGSDESDADGDEEEEEESTENKIIDMTETNLINFRKTVYLKIQSSSGFEEAAHKLMQLDIDEAFDYEFCCTIMDACAQKRTYEKFFGLLAERMCRLNERYIAQFERLFKEQYETCHRLELGKLRIIATFFGYLLCADAISWGVLEALSMTEETTTSSGRIFIKHVFLKLSQDLGIVAVNERLSDPTLSHYFIGLFPIDHPKSTRFSINFFTSIGLGGLTDNLREHLTKQSRAKKLEQMARQLVEAIDSTSSSSSSSDESDDASKKRKKQPEVKKEHVEVEEARPERRNGRSDEKENKDADVRQRKRRSVDVDDEEPKRRHREERSRSHRDRDDERRHRHSDDRRR